MDEEDRESFEKPIAKDRIARFMFGEVVMVEADAVIPHGSTKRRVAPRQTRENEPPLE
ncbi:MAG: hypothetical protein ACFBRM_03135 [Pikeienuella sp.]